MPRGGVIVMEYNPNPSKANLRRIALIGLWALLGGFLNMVASFSNMAIGSPLFMDSIATALVGALFGPWAGMLCAFFSHFFMELVRGFNGDYMPFVVCNMATGLIVGLFARQGKLLYIAFAVLCAILVTLANAILGTTVAIFFFGGITGHASDFLVTGFLAAGGSLVSAAFWARVPVNLVDKGLAVAIAVLALRLKARRVLPAG